VDEEKGNERDQARKSMVRKGGGGGGAPKCKPPIWKEK